MDTIKEIRQCIQEYRESDLISASEVIDWIDEIISRVEPSERMFNISDVFDVRED